MYVHIPRSRVLQRVISHIRPIRRLANQQWHLHAQNVCSIGVYLRRLNISYLPATRHRCCWHVVSFDTVHQTVQSNGVASCGLDLVYHFDDIKADCNRHHTADNPSLLTSNAHMQTIEIQREQILSQHTSAFLVPVLCSMPKCTSRTSVICEYPNRSIQSRTDVV